MGLKTVIENMVENVIFVSIYITIDLYTSKIKKGTFPEKSPFDFAFLVCLQPVYTEAAIGD